MNYKRKQISHRKFRHFRRGWAGILKDQKRKQIDKDHFNNILELVSKYNFYKKVL